MDRTAWIVIGYSSTVVNSGLCRVSMPVWMTFVSALSTAQRSSCTWVGDVYKRQAQKGGANAYDDPCCAIHNVI